MKRFVLYVLIFFCLETFSQKIELLQPKQFEKKIKDLPTAQILDVRTLDEFRNGAIENAMNVDFNSEEFKENIQYLDKTKPVLIYCFSGGRSALAAKELSKNGFTTIYDLQGGYRDWLSKKKPVGTESSYKGMTNVEFMNLIKSDLPVLTIFTAKWCPPCKRLAPIIDQIEKENSTNVKVVRIDIDIEKDLCTKLGVDKFPSIVIFKEQKEYWSNIGFIEKAELVNKIYGK